MLITAISLTESFIISKRINKQITSLPQDNTNRTTTTKNEEKSLQLSRMKRQNEDTLKAFVNITQAIPINPLPHGGRTFRPSTCLHANSSKSTEGKVSSKIRYSSSWILGLF